MARRRFWLVLLTTVLVAAVAALVASLRPVTYTADSVLVVPSGAGGDGPGQANEALTLAATYAELLPRDRRLVAAVGEATGQEASVVASRLSAAPVGDTALLRLSYTDPDGPTAVLGSVTAAQTVLGGLETVAPRSLRLVDFATADSVTISGGVTRSTVPVGALLGLALGLVLAAAAERADRRVDRPRQLAELVGAPAVDLDRAGAGDLASLVRVVRQRGTSRLAVLPVRTSLEVVERACDGLVDALPGLSRGDDEAAGPGDLRLFPLDAVQAAGEISGEPVAVVVPRGARRRQVREELADLEALGLAPVAAAFLVRRA